MDGFIHVSPQGGNVLLAQGHDFLILPGPVLGLLFRGLLNATLEFPFSLLEVGLLGHTTHQQSETSPDDHQHDRPAPLSVTACRCPARAGPFVYRLSSMHPFTIHDKSPLT